ncbi:MAG: chromosomal replication initiator protein DnaA [Gammaproteobacteria bacterium]|nr:chromosomal replication initiator protein DnaA [Gammaproteobacteria bacterium]
MTKEQTLWDKCVVSMTNVLSEKQMKTWILPLKATIQDRVLNVIAPNKFIKESVETNFMSLIKKTVDSESSSQVSSVLLSLMSTKPAQKEEVEGVPAYSSQQFGSSLNGDLVFESFVEGKSNQLAKAACLSVVSNLGQYNPLYIYGGVGLGKTHLLHSIGNEILKNDQSKKVIYLHSEKFVQNMVTALRHNQIEEFKKIYRSADALLLDDIQFFAGKERSQEEFFHTFNSLFEYKKQVVLTCDKYPKEIDGLEDRLKSRLVWGMNVSIDPPDLETRVAIIHSKAEQSEQKVPEDVAFFLAKNVHSNVRELEGSLRRVFATAHFKREEITLNFVKDALKDLLALQERIITIEHIQKVVAQYYKIRVSDILSTKRDRKITLPRHMAMYLSKEMTRHSLPTIGDSFGGRDHTTVIHACKKIEQAKTTMSTFDQDYKNILHILNN